MLDDAARDALRARLAESRAALLAALEGLTEHDFGADLGGGQTVVQALAALAEAERRENAEVRGETSAPPAPGRPLPPQVVHALAGASYRSRRYLESPEADASSAKALVDGIVEREASLAERIRNRPPTPPPPVFPMAQR
jgi:phage tail tape-measure protein